MTFCSLWCEFQARNAGSVLVTEIDRLGLHTSHASFTQYVGLLPLMSLLKSLPAEERGPRWLVFLAGSRTLTSPQVYQQLGILFFLLPAYLFVFLLKCSWVSLNTPWPDSLVLLSLEASAVPLGCSLWRVTGSAHAVGSTGQAWSCPPVALFCISASWTWSFLGRGPHPLQCMCPLGSLSLYFNVILERHRKWSSFFVFL